MTLNTVLPLLTILLCGTAVSAAEEADPLPQNSRWLGSLKFVHRENGKPAFKAHDCRILVTKRDGDNFEGEFWWNNDAVGYLIGGRVAGKRISFTVLKDLKGDSKDLVNNVRVSGRLDSDKGTINCRFTVPGTDRRYGVIEVKKQL